jgi:hypothetical protein
MQLVPTFNEIEHAIGGRPSKEKKIRMSFYLTKQEAKVLKSISQTKDITMSVIVRKLVQGMMNE